MRDRLTDAAINQGYTPDGAETGKEKLTDHKEAYEHRRFNNDRSPSEEEIQGFRLFMDGFYMVLPFSRDPNLRADFLRNATLFHSRSFVLWH